MDNSYILFIDSGIGGVSILQYLLSLQKNLNILYCADTLHFPYGTKEEAQIGSYLLAIYGALEKKYPISLIVIACNTASVSALAFLRSRVQVPVVGTVPAVKVAAEHTRCGSFGVIATETTVKIDYLSNLIKNFAGDKKVYVRAAQKLVGTVENVYLMDPDNNRSLIQETIAEELAFFKDKPIDYLVLGCTHYSFLTAQIETYFEHKVTLADSREGVSKRILYLLNERGFTPGQNRFLFVTDQDSREKYRAFNNKLDIFSQIEYLDLEKKSNLN